MRARQERNNYVRRYIKIILSPRSGWAGLARGRGAGRDRRKAPTAPLRHQGQPREGPGLTGLCNGCARCTRRRMAAAAKGSRSSSKHFLADCGQSLLAEVGKGRIMDQYPLQRDLTPEQACHRPASQPHPSLPHPTPPPLPHPTPPRTATPGHIGAHPATPPLSANASLQGGEPQVFLHKQEEPPRLIVSSAQIASFVALVQLALAALQNVRK